MSQKVTAGMVERLGHRVTVVSDGQEALDAVRSGAFDLITMDCQMPVMNGVEATAAIRALPGARGRVPIVTMTASAQEGDRQRCLDAGMDDYISKPTRPGEICEVLERVLGEEFERDGSHEVLQNP